jgi:hypothetical protein
MIAHAADPAAALSAGESAVAEFLDRLVGDRPGSLGPQQFCAVLRGKCFGLFDELRHRGLVKLWRRLGPGRDRLADGQEELFLAGR